MMDEKEKKEIERELVSLFERTFKMEDEINQIELFE